MARPTGLDDAFVDYSGVKLHIVDRSTGEVIPVELFVGVLGASNYTSAEATLTQRSADFIVTVRLSSRDRRPGSGYTLA